uniref:Peptidase M12B domain-containing protein n=1 Tax=Caenorhabditis japonica TaxID=281687 RepID=A0A8R1HY72_CAEJA
MTPLELKHFFGTENKNNIPKYFLDNVEKSRTEMENGFKVDFLIDGVMETFVLRNKPHLFSEGFHIVDEDMESVTHPLKNCVYEGESAVRNGTFIGLVGCGRNLNGMIITDNGDYHLIQSHHPSGQHVIHKRSLESIDHECQFDMNEDPYPEDRQEIAMKSMLLKLVKDIRRVEHKRDVLTVELAVFADDAMWEHFQKIYGKAAEENMHTFIMAVVNNIDVLYTQRLLQPRINIKIVRYEILKNIPQIMNARKHSNGDVDRLLDSFCQYQNEINPPNDADPRHWDHALLFSGYDLHRNGVKTVAGYAPVKGMCSGVRSCTINEGLDFGSVFVVTHEMGHSLGMYHDGDNECDLRCCIMSPSVGSGKTHWSHCSVNEMATFVGHLGDDFRPPNCLQDAPNTEQRMTAFKESEPPGQLFTLDEQCEIFHGECWKHELKDGQTMQNVCQMVWCGNGEGVIRTAHPALEGTYCGFGMICRQGQCVGSSQLMRVTVGGWSSWNDRPAPTCGGRCSQCEIRGQIRIMRSVRQCNNPSTNNGGAPCQGDEARGMVCHRDVCDGDTIDNYATRICSRLRDENAIPNTVLSGEGMQFEQAMCKIWCLISGSTNIRTVSNFPDGTPCGSNQFCIKGECRPLLCGSTTLAYSEADCPLSVLQTTTTQSPMPNMHTVDQSATKTSPYKEQKKRVPCNHNFANAGKPIWPVDGMVSVVSLQYQMWKWASD